MVTRRRVYYIGLLAACIATRLAGTIYYVEDTDSLRFALSVADEFDVANLQPHFPGYPVFWAAAKVLFGITGSFAVSFSLIGGAATFAVVYFAVRLSRRDPLSIEGLAIAFLLFFNPMIWLMGNRYMPDLMGLAVALGALSLLMSSRPAAGGVMTGLLAGTRLSYSPLLLPAYVWALRREPLRLLAASAAGVLVWLVPLVIDTGLSGLIGAAGRQTEGHFTEFGGTIETDPGLVARSVRLFEALWADGFGAWWPGRHWLTLVVAAALLVAGVAAVAVVFAAAARERRPSASARAARERRSAASARAAREVRPSASARVARERYPSASSTVPPRTPRPRFTRAALLIAAALTYIVWIFLFQNIIYKSRHVLPLVALLAVPLGLAIAHLVRARTGRRLPAARGIAAAAAATAYAAVTIVLVLQHREPTAIAQVKHFADETRPDVVASIPLVNYYLSAQGVEATYLSVQDQEDRERLARAEGRLLVVGRYPGLMPSNPARADTFYHNPYVNRMWPEVEVYVYDR